jgi:general secretion pathway protein K
MLSTLLVLTVVAGVLLDHALRARVERRIAINFVDDVRLRAAADAGIEQLLSRLRVLQARSIERSLVEMDLYDAWNRAEVWAADLENVVAGGGGVRYSVRIADASSRLSLNFASEQELRTLFLALGGGATESEIAAQSILDWRDPDDLHRPRGAEWDDYYRHLEEPVRPRNGAFESVDEARHVRGMERLHAVASPYLTVASGGTVNLNSAPAPVLRALPGLTDELVTLILDRRVRGEPIRGLHELEAELSPPTREQLHRHFADLVPRVIFEPQIFEIVAVARHDAGPLKRVVEVTVVRSGSAVQVLRRTEG